MAVSSSPSLPHLRHLHALAVRLPLPATSLPFLLSRLLRRLAALPPPPHAPLPYALNVFSAVSPPDPFLAAALLRFAFLTQPPLLPFRVFSHLRRAHGAELPFLPFAFSTLAKSATASRSLPTAAAAHAVSVLVGGFDRHRFVENSLIGAYVACGDVGAARKVFDEMVEKDVISWTSIVVAYTRSGDMRSAEEVFGRCPVKDMVAWTAMVTGYAQNAMPVKALEVFDRMAELGMVIDEVSLTAGKWEEVSKVRILMRKQRLKKDPAVSLFEGRDGLVHQFFAGDNAHPRTHEIKKALLELVAKLKLEGYVPILSSIVYDVNDEEKERLLMGHSEKLALSFGLLTLGSGCTIRIIKNLRICDDCHLFMRLVSRVESVEIIVRDNMRFHHFKNGECSCGGFW
ncbi:hypothetical protein OsI_24298 [Oryza sativa Indica Group]|uniref:DYW domain-containing protein n=1 Tax=Oryza sativa subsp. indica TaxID=39946 RepID=B8B1W2_ORYSI|nr:hypothetical protein OsI_24298 [Oryza sativa Indica Group]